MKKSTSNWNKRAMINKNGAKIQKLNGYSQGKYRVRNKEKCQNKGGVIEYKSSYEAKFAYELDVKRKNVISWSYELLTISYRSPIDKKLHRYYVDFVFDVKIGNKIQKYLVEIKPHHEKLAITEYWKTGRTPILHGNMKASSKQFKMQAFLVNKSKWESCQKYCDKKGYKFLIITEKELFGK